MRRHSFVRQLQSLPREKQLIGLTSLVAIVSCFLPWYGINSRVINEWWNAFGSIGSVAGYVITGCALLSLTLIVVPAWKSDLDLTKKLPFSESALLVFFSAQSLFTSVLFIPVYAQYALINATNSGTRFGLYIAIISTLVGSVVAIAYHQKVQRGEAQSSSFASVPRTHQDISEWEEEEPVSQEQMFDPQEDEEELVSSYSSERNIVADTTENDDDFRNLYS